MMRAVFDTNTLASAAIATGGPLMALVDAWQRGTVQVAISQHILDELETTLGKPYFVGRLSEQPRASFLASLRATTVLVPITAAPPVVAATRADNLVLATAASAGAAYLVTGDLELLRLRQSQDVAIVSPRQFLDVLDDDDPRPWRTAFVSLEFGERPVVATPSAARFLIRSRLRVCLLTR